jgi:hypothetical protein
LEVQVHGAALGVAERPDRDGDCAGQGGRGRALQEQGWVRFSGCILVSLVCHSVGADGPCTRSGAAGIPIGLCRQMALHWASLEGHKVTAMALVKAGADVHWKDNSGYGSRAASLCRLFATLRGRTVRPPEAELQEWLFWL